jgi:putative lipoic acid-binding regulatory protein
LYLRFVLQKTNDASGVREGLFPTAYALHREGHLPPEDLHEVAELLQWFERNLATPDRFNRTTSKGHYRRKTRGIAWLKPTASAHIDKMRQLVALLDRHDHTVEMLTSDRPGYVVYEDDAQLIAEPFRDTET